MRSSLRRARIRLAATSLCWALFAAHAAAQAPSPADPSAIAWAKDWDEAADRAKRDRRPVLVLVELFRGLDIPRQLPLLFADADLAALLVERFVPLQWKPGMRAPFQDPEVWGMGDSTFGLGLLVTDADGRVIGQVPATGTVGVDCGLRAVLERHPELPGDPPDPAGDPLARAVAHYRRGELAEAEGLLRGPDSVDVCRLRAALFRRLRRGGEALVAIAEARRLGAPEPDMTMEEVKVLFGLGRVADAIRSCDRVLANHGDSPRAAEARYLRVALLGITDPGKARQGFEELAAELEGSVWGAAARNMLGPGRIEALRHARIGWPDDPTLEVVRSLPYRPLPPDRAAEAESDAVVLLLRSQRPDGAWIVPWNLTGEAAPFVMAVTSICAGSLVGFRAREGVPAAVARALDHVLGMVEGGVLDGQTATYGFGYEVWGRTFALRLLAACSREGIGDGKRLAGAMNRLVGELERDQLEGGGWSYFKGAEIVFVTAAVLVALEDARAAGVEIPPGVTRRAAGALVRSRGPDGGFGYMLGRPGGAAESCLRSPLCALALFRAKEGGLRGVRKALVLYLKFREDVAPERGKVMCHTGVGGTAPYYLLFGYAFASEALLELPENERARFRKALLEDVLACRLEDGGFLDFIPVGRYCGTGLALGALARLREPR